MVMQTGTMQPTQPNGTRPVLITQRTRTFRIPEAKRFSGMIHTKPVISLVCCSKRLQMVQQASTSSSRLKKTTAVSMAELTCIRVMN